jgi:site-specific DNA-methyltransferase (adenine-specific)
MIGLRDIETASIDCILTDPPYLYLKNQKLDKPFDEDLVFSEYKRVLKPNGVIVLFGRGTSFYRWNTKLADLGFNFKEEIIWDKISSSTIFNAVSRIHETISIHSLGNYTLNKYRLPYDDKMLFNQESILNDINRIKSGLKGKDFEDIKNYVLTHKEVYNRERKMKHRISFSRTSGNVKIGVGTLKLFLKGFKIQSVVRINTENYQYIHPTQKPVELLTHLLKLCTHEGQMVLDTFVGSGSTRIACYETNRNFIGFELDSEYYDLQEKRYQEYTAQQRLF